MKKELAEQTSILMLQVSAKLNQQLGELQDACDPAEFKRYRRGFGYVLGYMYTDIMRPIYKEHPELEPGGLEGPYKVDPSIYEE